MATISDTAPVYATAFLNSKGGKILWGVNDKTKAVVGVPLTSPQRDDLSQRLPAKLSQIRPEVDPTRYRLSFVPVEGGSTEPVLYVVELSVPRGHLDQTYCFKGDFHVRLDGISQKLDGLRLADWIKSRQSRSPTYGSTLTDSAAIQLVQRVRETLRSHGLEPAHMARFMEQRRAPFTLGLADSQSDSALLLWINDERLDWLASTFQIRREWLDGEDNQVHERFYFDKQPERFFSCAEKLMRDLPAGVDSYGNRFAYFIRSGKGRRWLTDGRDDVIVVLATPIAYLNSEKVVYVSDLTPYPWTYGRTHTQLRAWSRLLFVELGFSCQGFRADLPTLELLQTNGQFLMPLLVGGRVRRVHDWCPEDYGLYKSESHVAKETESMPDVETFLREHDLPCAPSWGKAKSEG